MCDRFKHDSSIVRHRESRLVSAPSRGVAFAVDEGAEQLGGRVRFPLGVPDRIEPSDARAIVDIFRVVGVGFYDAESGAFRARLFYGVDGELVAGVFAQDGLRPTRRRYSLVFPARSLKSHHGPRTPRMAVRFAVYADVRMRVKKPKARLLRRWGVELSADLTGVALQLTMNDM